MAYKSRNEAHEVTTLLNKIRADDPHRTSVYNSLSLADDYTFDFIDNYVQNTHSPKHGQYSTKLVKVFEIGHPRDEARYKSNGNCKLLFHGTELEFVYPILRDGFRHSVSEPGLFGKGIYFTDCSSKAANFTCDNPVKFDGAADQGRIWPDDWHCAYIFLCQVAIGESVNYNFAPKNKDKHYLLENEYGEILNSVMGVGKRQPSYSENFKLKDGSVVDVPCGPLKMVQRNNYLHHNEYAVYNSTQVCQRYLLIVNFRAN